MESINTSSDISTELLTKTNDGECVRWWRNGKLHREDGPAVEHLDGRTGFNDGRRHRLSGPALESPNRKEWWEDGVPHRSDGPAVEDNDGCNEWYIRGVAYDQSDFPLNRVIRITNDLAYLDQQQIQAVEAILGKIKAIRQDQIQAVEPNKPKI